MITESWLIRLFGGLRAEQGERRLTRFRTHHTGALLAYLTYHPGRSHPREALIEHLWPHVPLESGRHSLSMALSSLRSQLEPPGVPSGSVIIADRLSVEVSSAAVTTDVSQFEGALRAAAQTRDESVRRQHLTKAMDLYGGTLLPGYYQDWIVPEQERLAQRSLEAARELARLLARTGNLAEAGEYARRAITLDPLREEAHQDLIRLLLAARQPQMALEQYRVLERTLQEALGERPSPASRQLLRQIEADIAAGITGAGAGPKSGAAEQATQFAPPPAASPTRPAAADELLPEGTVTFLLTDIEDSTALWERIGEPFRATLERHHQLLREAFRRHGGREVKETGDGFVVAFPSVAAALACAVAAQRSLHAEIWPTEVADLSVRMALDTGDVHPEAEGGYHAPVLHRASRILAAAHGGQVLVSDALAGLARRDLEAGLRLSDMGVYRFRSVELPERLFQLEWPDMPVREFGPLLAERARSGNLPLQFTRFFGREQEIQRIEEIFRTGETRLLTLTGPGGTGKTRLAIEAADRLAEFLASAVWFVPLADLSEPGLIAGAIADALHLPRSGVDPMEQALEALSQQPSLLLLDNFEQLVDGGAEMVQDLLAHVPSLRCLVASRHLLNLAGEREFPVLPLPTPHGANGPEQLGMFESVQMFLDRAQAVKPDFQVTNSNAVPLAELCDRLEGIPLAIELAAGRAQMLTPTQMLLQLGKRFEFLVSRKRGVAERHRTLRATVNWSYRLLSPELQRFFAGLSVFRGGWTLEAAEAVCDEPLALDYLAQLIECSLVIVEDEERLMRAMVLRRHVDFDPTPGGQMRFRLLETLREFANEQLTPEERTNLQRRHLEHFLRLAEEAEPKLLGPEEVAWRNRLEIEHDNLLAALDWAPESLADAEMCARLTSALSWFWILAGHSKEGRRRQEAVLERSKDVGGSIQAKLLHCAARAANFHGDHAQAISLYTESLSLYRQAGNKGAIGRALLGIGESVYHQGYCEKGKSLVLEGLALCREQSDLFGKDSVGGCLYILGEIAKLQGDYDQAKSFFEECLSIFEDLSKPNGIGIAIGGLADTAMLRRDYDAAHSLYERGLALRRKCGARIGIINALRYVAVVARLQEEYDYASACLQESMCLLQQVDARIGEFASPHLLTEMAEVERARGNYVLAYSLLQESLTTLFTNIKSVSGTAFALEGFRALAVARGQMERAARLFGAVEATREKMGGTPPPFTIFQPEYDRDVAAVRAALGEEAFTTFWAEGRAMTLEQAVALAQETGDGNRS